MRRPRNKGSEGRDGRQSLVSLDDAPSSGDDHGILPEASETFPWLCQKSQPSREHLRVLGPRSEMDAITDFVQDAFFHMRKPSERGGSNYCLKGGTVLRRLCLYAISSVKALVRAEKGLVWIRTGTHASLRYKEHFSIILLSHQCTVGLFMWLSWFK